MNSETNEEWVSNETTLSFASNTTSYLVKLTSQYASTGSPATREYTLYIKKFFVPELTQKTWAAANASGNIDLVFEFRDENNSPIASGIDWTGGSASSLSYDNKVTIESYSPGNSSGKFQGLLVKQEILFLGSAQSLSPTVILKQPMAGSRRPVTTRILNTQVLRVRF